jgi:hypothetical protein
VPKFVETGIPEENRDGRARAECTDILFVPVLPNKRTQLRSEAGKVVRDVIEGEARNLPAIVHTGPGSQRAAEVPKVNDSVVGPKHWIRL